MRIGLFALLASFLLTLACTIGSDEANHVPETVGEWVSLFDGETLNGWSVACKPEDAGKDYWKVVDGAITCDGRGRPDHDYVWLLREGEYSDFELQLKVRAFPDSTGNSGIQVRSRYDAETGWLDGPQIDVHPSTPFRVGLIYDETREARRWIYPSLENWKIDETDAPHEWTWHTTEESDGWNEIHIVCQGTHIKTLLNGQVITDQDFAGILDDEAHRAHNVGLRGYIGLQNHAKAELHIQYKDIRIRELP